MTLLDSIKRIMGIEKPPPGLPPGELKFTSELGAKLIKADGKISDFGVVSRRVVTNAFVNRLVDCMQDSTATPLDVFFYHDCGTGNAAESATETALVGAYGGSRSSGSKTEGASANIYKTVGTITFTSSFAITEHAVFSTNTGGIMLDRSSHAAINVASDDSIEYTYQLTCSAGG